MRPCTIASRELAGSIGYAAHWANIQKKSEMLGCHNFVLYHIACQKLEGQ